ncbi:MAG: hypothetical protein ABI488_14840 [Polyangiaceae bacterium]
MTRSPRRNAARALGVLAAIASIAACNVLAGIDKPRSVVDPALANGGASGSGTGGSSSGTDAGPICLHNSDCADDRVCLFQHCSFPCAEDRDCQNGARCLNTDVGQACIVANAACAGGCPSGSVCSTGTCRNSCKTVQQCLADQDCVTGICRGNDSAHETPGTMTGEAGAGGASGAAAAPGAGGAPESMPDAGTPLCTTEAELRCDGAGEATRSVCTQGQWVAADPCAHGQLCDNSSPAAACKDAMPACVGMKPGAKLCDGVTRITCGPDLVTAETHDCQDAAHCADATGSVCAACIDTEYSCDGSLLKKCNALHTGFDNDTDCGTLPCNSTLGMCTVKVCAANQFTCDAPSNTLDKCNADGTAFASQTPCHANICDAAGGQCDVCVANTALNCKDAANKTVCNADGQGTHTVKCSDESASTPVCVGIALCRQCSPGDTQCSDLHGYQTCINSGQWSTTVTPCTGQACSLGKCIGSCEPGAVGCVDKANYEKCSNLGAPGPSTSCGGNACYLNQCTGSCVPGTQSCATGATTTQPQTCADDGSVAAKGVACVLYDSICKVTSNVAACTANAAYPLGETTAFSTTTSVVTDMIFGNPVLATKNEHVAKFALIPAGTATLNCNVRMILYADDGSQTGKAGNPAALLGNTALHKVVAADVSANLITLDSTTGQISLVAGKYYWVMGDYACSTPVVASQADTSKPDLKYATVASGSVPAQFPAASTAAHLSVSQYLMVQDLP